jgi:hypothetical protein
MVKAGTKPVEVLIDEVDAGARCCQRRRPSVLYQR